MVYASASIAVPTCKLHLRVSPTAGLPPYTYSIVTLPVLMYVLTLLKRGLVERTLLYLTGFFFDFTAVAIIIFGPLSVSYAFWSFPAWLGLKRGTVERKEPE